MVRLRLIGPRPLLGETLRAVQDLGVLHLAPPPPEDRLTSPPSTSNDEREARRLRRAAQVVDAALAALDGGAGAAPARPPRPLAVGDCARWARLAGRVERAARRLDGRAAALDEERALLEKYGHFFHAFATLLASERRWPNASAHHVLLKGQDPKAVARLQTALAAAVGDAFALHAQPLPTGETAVLVIVAAPAAARVERLLAEARVEEMPVPAGYGGPTLAEAIPHMTARLAAIPGEVAATRTARAALRQAHTGDLLTARAALRDRLAQLGARTLSRVSAHTFVIDGWLPAETVGPALVRLRARLGDRVAVSEVGMEEWAGAEAVPVVLRNPRLFRPFEAVVNLLPLPRYGTIDPTPFVAVFFPAFFGLMLGDVGYGALLGVLAGVLHRRSRPGTVLRSVAEIAGAFAVCAILGGVLYGELFGDLGHRWFGLRPVAFDRGEALVPFLILAVSLGLVHVVLGLVLGAVAAFRHHRRQAWGRGISAVMVVLIPLALLAAAGVLPHGFFTPAVIALLIAFPVLIVVEGLVGALELLSTLGHVLSYARIMALGLASVMLAVVANRMAGAVGSALVGVLFALLFHLVNFAIGLFGPTVHALRLHYVEFFGKFYSPGGVRYQPFGHWPGSAGAKPT